MGVTTDTRCSGSCSNSCSFTGLVNSCHAQQGQRHASPARTGMACNASVRCTHLVHVRHVTQPAQNGHRDGRVARQQANGQLPQLRNGRQVQQARDECVQVVPADGGRCRWVPQCGQGRVRRCPPRSATCAPRSRSSRCSANSLCTSPRGIPEASSSRSMPSHTGSCILSPACCWNSATKAGRSGAELARASTVSDASAASRSRVRAPQAIAQQLTARLSNELCRIVHGGPADSARWAGMQAR